MKRRVKKKIKIIFSLIITFLIGIFSYLIAKNINNNEDFEFNKLINEKEKIIYPITKKISLVATGDALLHNPVYLDAYDKNTETFDFSSQMSMVKDIISEYDIAYYNQETVFGGKLTSRFNCQYNLPGYCSYPYFNSPSEFGDAMVNAGFNLVSLASNHSADCTYASDECITNSYNYWKSKNIIFDGFNEDESKENKYNIGTINDISYGFLAYTNTLNGLDGSVSDIKYKIDIYDEETVKKEVEDLKQKVDVVIVAMHWHKNSAEYETKPTQSNIQIANYLASLGVDIVLGTYSHCLQPFDIIDNTVVFYSLGNFISNQGDLISSIGYKGIVGVLASMDITKTIYEDGTSEIKIDNIGADLTYTYNKNHKNYLVIPFSKMNESYNANYKEIYEEYKNILTSLNQNINVKEIN
ncbi:MAG: CapA family protein [Bacilli bacterium]